MDEGKKIVSEPEFSWKSVFVEYLEKQNRKILSHIPRISCGDIFRIIRHFITDPQISHVGCLQL